MAKTITAYKLRSEMIVDAAKHSAAYKKAEGEVTRYEQAVKKSAKEIGRAFDGTQVGAKFGKDMGVSAIAALGQSFNVSTLGSIIGTAVAPGVGTAIGSAIGGGIDSALSKVTPMLLNTIASGVELNELLQDTRVEFTALTGTEAEANKYLNELLQVSKDLGVLPKTVIETSESLYDLTGNLKLTRTLLQAAADKAADIGGGEEAIRKVADALGLIAEKGDLSATSLKKLYALKINAPKLLADATGLSPEAIKKLMEQGRLRGDVAARLIAEGIERESGGLAAIKTARTESGLKRQFGVNQVILAAKGTENLTFKGLADFYEQANALMSSSQAQDFVKFVDKVSGQLINWTEKGVSAGVSVGAGFAQGLVGGDSLNSIMGSFTKMKDWVGGALGSVFEIHSPSEWSAREVGEPLGEGIGIGLVRRFGGFMQSQGADSIKEILEQLLADPKIQALLKTIETAEGGAVNVMAGGRVVNSGALHPGMIVPKSQWFRGSKGPSSASGLYQITLTNWKHWAPILGLDNFSDPRQQQMVALAIMADRQGGLSALRSGDIGQQMALAAKDWTSTPGSRIGGGGQWSSTKWLGRYHSFLGGVNVSRANPMPVTIVRDIIGGSSAERDPGVQFSDLFYTNGPPRMNPELPAVVGESMAMLTDDLVQLNYAAQKIDPIFGQIQQRVALMALGAPPLMKGVQDAEKEYAEGSIKITAQYQEAARRELIKGISVVDQLSGMLGQITGMVPGQQVGKKRGFWSKVLGLAAPFLSFVPGVGGILSTIVGAASGAVGGNYGAAISGIAGGLQPGGVFRPTRARTATPGAGHEARRAMGGPVYSGRPYVVGERGPEWFVPDSSGRVLPHGQQPGGSYALMERFAALLERWESMPSEHVVMTGAHGLNRALDRNAGLVEGMGRRLNLARS